MIRRSEIYWVDLGPASGSRPAKRRPVLVIQSQPYNDSRLATVLAAVVTSNTALADLPGNVLLPATVTGLPGECWSSQASVQVMSTAFSAWFTGLLAPWATCRKVPAATTRSPVPSLSARSSSRRSRLHWHCAAVSPDRRPGGPGGAPTALPRRARRSCSARCHR